MVKIVTTSQLQKKIGQIGVFVANSWVIIVNRGKPNAVLLPYFEHNDDAIALYLEDYEMYQNAEKLRLQLRESAASGMSDLIERFSKAGDLILDPFCGGGTTGVVSVRLNRRFVGVDVNQDDINTCSVRLKDVRATS